MYGTDTKQMDDNIHDIVSNLYIKYKKRWEQDLQSTTDKSLTLQFVRDVPYSDIVNCVNYFGGDLSHVSTVSDKGKVRMSKTDGGVICIKVGVGVEESIKIPIVWIETKSSNSCTTNDGQRGQATGLITEQADRCADWTYPFGIGELKPLIAIMTGTDFDEDRGTYNINRIREDLNTVGNIDPYIEESNKRGKRKGFAWFYYQEEISNENIRGIILNAIETNIEKLKPILSNLDTYILK